MATDPVESSHRQAAERWPRIAWALDAYARHAERAGDDCRYPLDLYLGGAAGHCIEAAWGVIDSELGPPTRAVLQRQPTADYTIDDLWADAIAKRAAELDAYRLLLERIYGLEISADTSVRDFVTESDRIRTATEGQLKGVRTMAVRYTEDGTVEVDMQVTLEQVITVVKKAYDEAYDGTKWTKSQFDDISKRTQRKVIGVTGTGALDTAGAAGHSGGSSGSETTTVEEEGVVVE
ncbi:MAG: LPP20 family lipoprotein [Planctomycetes bacterium]|nr:LPP20 family lipoprotein [Planctomycetota bacterium]